MNLENKNVLVTGANRGMGRAFVEALLSLEVSKVYAGARNPEQLGELRQHPRVVPLALDVTDPDSLTSAAAEVEALDLLINNAGSLRAFSLLAASREELQADLAVNYLGTLDVTRAMLPYLERSKGAVMNILSVVSLASMAGVAGYSASKAAAWSITQAMRKELAAREVEVFAVFPGPVDTDMIRSFEVEKASPQTVVARALEALSRSELNCFPDPMSEQVGTTWASNPAAVEVMFAED